MGEIENVAQMFLSYPGDRISPLHLNLKLQGSDQFGFILKEK